MKERIPLWLVASFVFTTLIAGYSLWQRYQVESENRAVGIVADSDTIQSLAASQGLSLTEALKKLKSVGLTGVVLPEETIGDLVTDGKLLVAPDAVRLVTDDPQLRARVARGLTQRYGIFIPAGDATVPVGSLNPSLARSASIGLDPLWANEAQALGLFVVARLGNPSGATEKYVTASLAWAAELGAKVFLPQGEQVLGRRDALSATVEGLIANKMLYATPEFAKIGGDANIVSGNPELVVRLHSAQTAELDKLGLGEAIERYGKAAAERNQRLLLVRPVSNAAAAPLDTFGEFVGKINQQLAKEGYTAGVPHAFKDSGVPVFVFVALALSTLPAFFWLFALLGRYRVPAFGFVALIALATALPAARGPFALLCTLAYPMIAFMLIERSPVGVFVAYLRTSVISLIGGLCVGGLLNGLPFFVKADAFDGVKVAHFLPIVLIGLFFFLRGTDGRAALKNPIFWQQAAIGLVLIVGFAFMASRTGNDGPAGVSGVELKLRALLDQIMFVRPRTKEFMIGHPAMIIALGLAASKRISGGWLAIAMMVGAIGQTSMVNTMCHLHTPITVSLARIGVGLVVGGILGAIGWGVLNRLRVQRT